MKESTHLMPSYYVSSSWCKIRDDCFRVTGTGNGHGWRKHMSDHMLLLKYLQNTEECVNAMQMSALPWKLNQHLAFLKQPLPKKNYPSLQSNTLLYVCFVFHHLCVLFFPRQLLHRVNTCRPRHGWSLPDTELSIWRMKYGLYWTFICFGRFEQDECPS